MPKPRPVLDLAKCSPGFRAANPHLTGAGGIVAPAAGVPATTEAPKMRRVKKRKEMNDLEEEFSMILDRQIVTGEIVGWEYEGITLRWGTIDCLQYTPDFCVFLPEGHGRLRLIETKGKFLHAEDIRLVKEARNYWTHFSFELHQRLHGQWGRVL